MARFQITRCDVFGCPAESEQPEADGWWTATSLMARQPKELCPEHSTPLSELTWRNQPA